MKQFLIILCVAIGAASWHGSVFAENWGGWSGWNKWEQGNEKNAQASGEKGKENPGETEPTEKRFCSYEQGKELLKLLEELDDPSLGKKRPGGISEVRRKYRIARKLRKFDDCRAEDALKALIQENACEDLGEGEIFCVKWGANASLQEVKSKKDLKKLTPETPLAEQVKVFKKYGPHPHENEFASHAVMAFLIEQADVNPKVYVPLIVEYFTTCHEIQDVVRKYPEETTIGLKRCLFSSKPTVVWAGINLARTLGKVNLFSSIYEVSFQKIGPLDYSQQDEIENIQVTAIGFFRISEKEALPYYRGILFGDSAKAKEYVVSGIKDLTSPELLALLKEYSSSLEKNPDTANSLPAQRVREKIARMEEARK
ncbi:MAG: hypothetical protein L3J49_02070 [Desulfobulbaceae bacterium]|nr:hypothetical protein [Desulfobulbaceae bacterium]